MSESDQQNELEAAQAELRKNPNLADSWNRVAIAFLKQGDLVSAIDYIGHAIALEPNEALHYSNRGRVLFTLKRHEESLADYTRAIELAPSAELYSSRSVVNRALGKDAAALFDINDAFELDPSVDNLLNRVAFFQSKGMAADALRDMTEIVAKQPDNPEHRLAHANLAFALAVHYPELYEVGLKDVEMALELDKTGALGQSLGQLADHLETFLPNSPNPEVSRRLIEMIRAKDEG
jgi:tetratricopeptide (TPR) repeat protein